MANEITLPVGATAEPDTCGSCKFFKRTMDLGPYNANMGICRFKLPPRQMEGYVLREYRDGDENRDKMQDIDRCDLYRFSGEVYIVQRRIPSERQ